jgi:hypothetical protein
LPFGIEHSLLDRTRNSTEAGPIRIIAPLVVHESLRNRNDLAYAKWIEDAGNQLEDSVPVRVPDELA